MEPARSDMQLCLRLSAAVGFVSACALSLCASADVSLLDAGELGGAAVSLGVPHPSGFSLDMLLLHAASFLPLGPLAFRQNVCVALLASAAVSCIAFACLRLVRRAGWSSSSAAVAAVSVSTAGLLSSRTFLDAALSVEVYATSLLCVALAGGLLARDNSASRRALWPLAGLALGAHVTAPLLILPVLCVGLVRRSRALALGVIAASVCALVVCYLPLASLRDTPFDWGDPQTFGRWLRHLSAARIREAYQSSLFTRDELPRLQLVQQLTEQPYWLPLALMGAIGIARSQRRCVLMLGILLCLDLGYAAWINPMGVAQRQVGHTSLALIAMFAGVGCALLVELLPLQLRAAGRLGVVMIAGACLWSSVRALAHTPVSDGYAVSERFGAASPLTELAPRALFVCESDSGCASALFAVYAEGIRPDVDVVPAQHLWDPTIVRRMRGLQVEGAADAWPSLEQRASLAERRQRELHVHARLRPVYAERPDHLKEVRALGFGIEHAPFIRLGSPSGDGRAQLDPTADDAEERVRGEQPKTVPTQQRLASLERARFGAAGPASALAKELWASAHEALGAAELASGRLEQAVAEFSRVVALTPLRAAARSNLGVALERRGDLHAALKETSHAVELDPQRPTPWVNLTRLLLRTQGADAARSALETAKRYEVRDTRLDALRRELQFSGDVTSGTTR